MNESRTGDPRGAGDGEPERESRARDGEPIDLFVYGSLMFEPVWSLVAGAPFDAIAARLVGFERLAVRDAPYPGIVPAPGRVVDGRLCLAVPPAAVARLDAFEGAEYARIAVQVETSRGVRAAWAYRYLDAARLTADVWDPGAFERRELGAFLRDAVAAGGRAGSRETD